MEIPWQLRFLISVGPAGIFGPYLVKKLAGHASRLSSLTIQYASIAAIMICLALTIGDSGSFAPFRMLTLLGILNTFACYAQWRAYDINLSVSSVFSFGHVLISIALGFIFLGERFPEARLFWSGLMLAALSIVILTYEGYLRGKQSLAPASGKASIGWWILLCAVIWGGIGFAMRVFALQGISVISFGASFYLGSFVGTLILNIASLIRGFPPQLVSKKYLSYVLLLSLLTLGSTLSSYWTLQAAPLLIVKPLDQITGLAFPLLAGLIFFGEGRQMTRGTWAGLILGISGGVMIALR